MTHNTSRDEINSIKNESNIPTYSLVSKRNFILGATTVGVLSVLGDIPKNSKIQNTNGESDEINEGVIQNISNAVGEVFENQLDLFLEFNNLRDVVTGTLKFKIVEMIMFAICGKLTGISLGNHYAGEKMEDISEMIKEDSMNLFFNMSIYAPVIEEMIFRYLPYKYFSRKDGKISWDVGIVTSIIFGYFHNFGETKGKNGVVEENFNYKMIPLPQITMGLLFYYLIEKYGIQASILSHITANTLGFSIACGGVKMLEYISKNSDNVTP